MTEIKNTEDLFKKLDIDQKTLSNEQKKFIADNGYLIIPPSKFIKENLSLLQNITSDLIIKEGDKGGWEGKEQYYKKGKYFETNADRLGNLIEKDIIFGKLILIPEILAAAYEVIQTDIKVGGLNFRNPHKGHGEQAIHIDGRPRKNLSDSFAGVVVYIYLDESKIENGATRVIPGTHKKLGWPDYHINTNVRHKDEVRTSLPAGSAVVLNLNTWHAGAKNISGEARKTIFVQIKRREEGQLLNNKKFLSKKTKEKLNEEQKYLLGIRDTDPTQTEDSVSVGATYTEEFGKSRGDIT